MAMPHTPRSRWQKSLEIIKNNESTRTDPWSEIVDLPEETAERLRYNAAMKKWVTDQVQVKMEQKPFAHGAQRECFRLKKLSHFVQNQEWTKASNYVTKRYLGPEVGDQAYFDDCKLQMDAKLWAEEYNLENPPKKVDIIQTCLLRFHHRPGAPYFALEHLIEGTYLKYNSNSGYVTNEVQRCTPQAFSHYTFIKSGHKLIVVDVQGVGDLYTDPQIHTLANTYGNSDLGVRGMALFFSSHRCNALCTLLGLTPFALSPDEHEHSPSPVHMSETVIRSNALIATPHRQPSAPIMEEEDEVLEVEQADDLIADMGRHMSIVDPEQLVGRTRRRSANSASSADLMGEVTPLPSNAKARILMNHAHIPTAPTVIAEIHMALAEYHRIGRFSSDAQPNIPAALFHLHHAAEGGVVPAMTSLANLYSGIQDDMLPEARCAEDPVFATCLYRLAAERQDRSCMLALASRLLAGVGVVQPLPAEAAEWWVKAASIAPAPDARVEAAHVLLSKAAEVFSSDSLGPLKDLQRAIDLLNEAAEKATHAGAGRASTKYYARVEELSALLEEEGDNAEN
eukprot:m.56771 g.56771  ORF g.56771 m.56771 type:complete len:567 (+) comp13413_c0_seq2:83-1783(+)